MVSGRHPDNYTQPSLVLSQKELDMEKEAAKVEIVQRMCTAGMSPDTVSTLTGVKIEVIKKVILKQRFTPEESMLSELARQVMAKSLTHLLYLLDKGDPQAQYNVSIKVINSAMRLIGNQNDTGAEFEEALEALLTMQRDIKPAMDKSDAA